LKKEEGANEERLHEATNGQTMNAEARRIRDLPAHPKKEEVVKE